MAGTGIGIHAGLGAGMDSGTPLPSCESNTLVGATESVVSATFGTVEFGSSFFCWPFKIKVFLLFEAGDGILGILITVLPPHFLLSCPLQVEIGESPDKHCIHDAAVAACVFLQARANC
jgi:hypothetical protein